MSFPSLFENGTAGAAGVAGVPGDASELHRREDEMRTEGDWEQRVETHLVGLAPFKRLGPTVGLPFGVC